ncbi:biosynthetic peptidoglycan transglycosylase [Clostridium psychrophilum]|uniref:biosynthetic peptidoglycan transglycosylase n=1 Tax=Clostridium psychrophilum TaxID=132926 RepID=UPI001C0E8A43|nr:biosynthetic peptidoglycan transglycosylase [Clostridium psychrophilum]MBU3183039.1 transglycosylase domain-containing protein [Clostridium psychrophilum]
MHRFFKRILKFMVFIFVVLCISWFGLKYYFGHVNIISNKVRSDVITQVRAHNSRLLAYSDIPKTYRKAIIATEDRSFFTNKGMDVRGTIRAIFVDVASRKSLQGGSTITQQLIHNTILSNTSKSLTWKLLESTYAIGVYDTMSKQETFAFYTNVIYFGHGANGLYQASDTYFGKSPMQLNAGELTMLAGLPNAPSVYDPYKSMKLAIERQHIVIQNMVDSQIISESQAKQIISEPIMLK